MPTRREDGRNPELAVNQNDPLQVVLSNAFLDRKGLRPLHVQIRNAIELAIFSGEIPDGTLLPSVRQLSNALNVAPNTIVRAYQDLRDEEWIDVAPKRGYYVRINGEAELPERVESDVIPLIDSAIDAASEAGISDVAFMQIVSERIRARRKATRRIAVVGDESTFLEGRVAMLAEATRDLGVEVSGISFQELGADAGRMHELEEIDLFVVPVGETRIARKLLGEHFSRVLPMTRTVHPDVKSFLNQQSPDTLFGTITSVRENISRLVGILKQHHPLHLTPLTASLEDPEEVEYVIEHAEVIVTGSRARPNFYSFDQIDKPCIEMVLVPDEKTVRRLRDRIVRL